MPGAGASFAPLCTLLHSTKYPTIHVEDRLTITNLTNTPSKSVVHASSLRNGSVVAEQVTFQNKTRFYARYSVIRSNQTWLVASTN